MRSDAELLHLDVSGREGSARLKALTREELTRCERLAYQLKTFTQRLWDRKSQPGQDGTAATTREQVDHAHRRWEKIHARLRRVITGAR